GRGAPGGPPPPRAAPGRRGGAAPPPPPPPDELRPVLADDAATERLVRLLGASVGLGEFLHRRPAEIDLLLAPVTAPWSQQEYTDSLLAAIDGATGEDARLRLRVRYRRHLAQIALFDVLNAAPTEAFPAVAAGL
ncbi:bifunctional glutamine-synthetase adenylyltransferase/deadenyltransferase, partial [Curtobacterium sp. CT11-45]